MVLRSDDNFLLVETQTEREEMDDKDRLGYQELLGSVV